MTSTAQHVYRQVDNGTVKRFPSALPNLSPRQVLVRITHSSLCATDLAFAPYGLALGHEGVGIVEKIGTEVSTLKVGDRVGGGYHRGSCGHCTYCLTGNDIWCYDRVIFGEGDFDNGTFADYFVGSESYVHKIPDSMSSEHASPLQCAGATVYAALVDTVKPNSRVGIVGIGGLGHLAIQFVSKMGAEAVVFSTSMNKEAEARSFGAKEFYLLSEVEKVPAPIQTLVITGSSYPNWSKFLVRDVLARQGTIVPLGAPHSPDATLDVPSLPMLFSGYNIHSSLVASRAIHSEMLNFAARNGIKPTIEKFEFSEEGFAEALRKIKDGSIRYRAVLAAE